MMPAAQTERRGHKTSCYLFTDRENSNIREPPGSPRHWLDAK
jgi:hypothetical protein